MTATSAPVRVPKKNSGMANDSMPVFGRNGKFKPSVPPNAVRPKPVPVPAKAK